MGKATNMIKMSMWDQDVALEATSLGTSACVKDDIVLRQNYASLLRKEELSNDCLANSEQYYFPHTDIKSCWQVRALASEYMHLQFCIRTLDIRSTLSASCTYAKSNAKEVWSLLLCHNSTCPAMLIPSILTPPIVSPLNIASTLASPDMVLRLWKVM